MFGPKYETLLAPQRTEFANGCKNLTLCLKL